VHLSFFVSLSILSSDAVGTAGGVQPSFLSPDVFRSKYVAAYLMASVVVQLFLEQQRCAEQQIPTVECRHNVTEPQSAVRRNSEPLAVTSCSQPASIRHVRLAVVVCLSFFEVSACQ
jgi:hypothetical protein